MANQQIIKKENRAVIINSQPGRYFANLYVNIRNKDKSPINMLDWDITYSNWSGKTLNGAIRWANRKLEIR